MFWVTFMPNHLHIIIYLQKESPIIKDVIGVAKRLMSYSIVSRLKKLNADDILKQIQDDVTPYAKKKGIKQKVFQNSLDGKECYTYEFMQVNLKYMHCNPVKAGFTDLPENYLHASAQFYFSGQHSAYPVIHYIEVYEGKAEYEYSKQLWLK